MRIFGSYKLEKGLLLEACEARIVDGLAYEEKDLKNFTTAAVFVFYKEKIYSTAKI